MSEAIKKQTDKSRKIKPFLRRVSKADKTIKEIGSVPHPLEIQVNRLYASHRTPDNLRPFAQTADSLREVLHEYKPH